MARQVSFGNGTRVFNLDEINTMTIQKCTKILAAKGQRQASKVTSAERVTTTCYIVNAVGNALPPMIIFPRVHFKQYMIAEMNSELFVKTMQHFIIYSNSSKNNPSLIIYDNHESHICIEALNLAKESVMTILTVTPHSTGKLQPLDVGIFGPFKTAYNKAVDSWVLRNPEKTFSIYKVARYIRDAHMKTMIPGNICAAVKATGIFPFDSNIFTDLDFAPSEVTDRQLNVENNQNEINRPNQDDGSRTPSPSILELSFSSLPQSIQIEEPSALATNSYVITPLPPCEVQYPRTPHKNSPADTTLDNVSSPIPQSAMHNEPPKALPIASCSYKSSTILDVRRVPPPHIKKNNFSVHYNFEDCLKRIRVKVEEHQDEREVNDCD